MSQPGPNEIERMLVKYRDQRRAEAGAALELHKAARAQLHAEVTSNFGTGFVSAQESAEKFARTLAWQQNLGRWWHGLVPKIGFAGACFAAAMVVFSIAHREAQQEASTPAPSTSDFLGMTPLEGAPDSEIVPESAEPLEDVRSVPPPPVITRPAPLPPMGDASAGAKAPARPVAKAASPAPAIAMEPRPEPAAMMDDESLPKPRQPSPKLPMVSAPAVPVAPPQWSAKAPAGIQVNLPNSLLEPSTVIVSPLPPPVAAAPNPSTIRTLLPDRAEARRPRTATLAAPTPAIAPASPPASMPPANLRSRFVASRPQPLLSRFDLVLAEGTISIRDEDGSIYRGKAVSAPSGIVEFTARGRHRGSGDEANLVGSVTPGGGGVSRLLKADVMLGDGRRFTLEAGPQ